MDKKVGRHRMGIRGIISDYSVGRIVYTFPFLASLFLSLILSLLAFDMENGNVKMLDHTTELFVGIFPDLLGFNLGGYALLLGFGNIEFLRSIAKPRKKAPTSIFQLISSIFALSLILQAVTLILSILVKQFMTIAIPLNPGPNVIAFTNTLVFFLLSFIGMWAILLIPYIITNVFTFGQMHHLRLNNERIEQQDQKSENGATGS